MPPVLALHDDAYGSTSSEPIPRTMASAKKTESSGRIQKIGLR